MSDIKKININELEKNRNFFDYEKTLLESTVNNIKSSSIMSCSNINIQKHASALSNICDNILSKYNRGINWLGSYIKDVNSLELRLIELIGAPKPLEETVAITVEPPKLIPIKTVISSLGLTETVLKDGRVLYKGQRGDVHYIMHLPKADIGEETSMILSFNGGGETGSKPGDFSKIQNSLGLKAISEEKEDVQDKVVVLAVQLQENNSLKVDFSNQVASLIKDVQKVTGITQDKTGSLSHSIGGRFSLILASENPDIIGWGTVVSPSKNRENRYDLDKINNLLSNNPNIKIIWGSSDNNGGETFTASPAGVSKTLLETVAGVKNQKESAVIVNPNPLRPTLANYINEAYPKNQVVSFEHNGEEQFIKINGMGHGIGDKVARASLDYFLKDYLKELPAAIATNKQGGL